MFKKTSKIILVIVIAAVIFALILFRPKNQTSNPSSNISAVTSIYPIYFFTHELAGPYIEVTQITPAGIEPHDYEPTEGDIAKISHSNLLIVSGNFETWTDKVKSFLSGKNNNYLDFVDLMDIKFIGSGNKQEVDPHFWLDPDKAAEMVDHIASALSSIDPTHSSYYSDKSYELKNQLNQVKEEYMNQLKSCSDNKIITSHESFGYLARKFGLEELPISGLSPDSEPSLKDMASIADFAKRNNVKYIFFENTVNPKLSETIANETGAKTAVLNPIESLTPDETNSGSNYFTSMNANLKTLVIALNCK